jgi:hypothetical protein
VQKSKRNPANSIGEAVKAAQAAALPEIAPPAEVFLREIDRPHWSAIVRARAREEWTSTDLVLAANFARCLADIERISRDLAAEPDVVTSSRGTPVPNPKFSLIDVLSRRAVALQRVLQMQPALTGRLANRQATRAAEAQAREVFEHLRAETDLIPTE